MELKKRFGGRKEQFRTWCGKYPQGIYYGVLIAALAVGALLVTASTFLSHGSLGSTLVEELGIAFWVAAIVGGTIETYARLKFGAELGEGIAKAIFGRMITPEVYAQVQDHIFKALFVRKNYCLTLRITRQRNTNDFDCSTTLTYDVLNLTQQAHEVDISHGLDHDIRDDESHPPLPRFIRVEIGNQTYSDEQGREGVELLSKFVDGYRFTGKTMLLTGNNAIKVKIEASTIIRAPDTWNWNMSNLTTDVIIKIIKPKEIDVLIGFAVKALHPNREKLKADSDNGKGEEWTWQFEPALLPWQGFEFTSFRHG